MSKRKILTQNNSLKGVIITLFLVLFLGTAITIFSDTYTLTLEENRKLTYGAWHIAVFDADETVKESLSNHAAIESVGSMHLSGMVLSDDSPIGGIGYLDEDLLEIGNITLLDGHLPETNNEIAIEAGTLNRLGMSLMLGQQIPLSISNYDEAGNLLDCETQVFTLTGVIKNYSANWKSNSHWLVTCFVSKDYVSNHFRTSHVFVKMDDALSKHADSLQPLVFNKGVFTKNDYTYLQYGESASSDSTKIILQTAIILSGCLTIIILIINELNRRKVAFVTMRVLGATKLQIVRFFLRERIFKLCIAGCTGIVTGIILPFIVISFINIFLSRSIYFNLSIIHIVQISLFSFCGLIVALGVSISHILSTPLRGRIEQQVRLRSIKHRHKPLSKRNLSRVLDYSNRGKRWISLCLTFAFTVLVLLSAYDAYNVYQDYQYFSKQYPEDYSFGMLASYYNPHGSLSPGDIELVRNTYGVSQVYAFSASDYVDINSVEPIDQEYAKAAMMNIPQNAINSQSDNVKATVIGITENLQPIYLQESNTEKTALEDNEIIVFVPDLCKIESDIHLLHFLPTTERPESIIQEGSIQIGQEIIVNTANTHTKLTVAGVIHTVSPDLPISYQLARPFSILCNENTYAKIFGECHYTYALVYGNPATIQYQTDVELSKIKTQLNFSNNRVFREDQLISFTERLILSLITLCASFSMAIMIRCGIQAQTSDLEKHKMRILHRLGMSKKEILCMLSKRVVTESLWGAIGAILVFGAQRFIQEKLILFSASDYYESKSVIIFLDIIRRCLHYTNWIVVIIVLTATILINGMILVINERQSFIIGKS